MRRIAAAWMVLVCASCSSSRVREEGYVPDRETLRVKSDPPIVELWDRWNDRPEDRVLVDGKHAVPWSDVPKLLADDPSAEVASKLAAHKLWGGVASTAGYTAAIAASLALIGYVHNKEDQRTYDISLINIFWGVAGISGLTYLVSEQVADSKLRDALPIHNERIQGQKPLAFQVSWEGHF